MSYSLCFFLLHIFLKSSMSICSVEHVRVQHDYMTYYSFHWMFDICHTGERNFAAPFFYTQVSSMLKCLQYTSYNIMSPHRQTTTDKRPSLGCEPAFSLEPANRRRASSFPAWMATGVSSSLPSRMSPMAKIWGTLVCSSSLTGIFPFLPNGQNEWKKNELKLIHVWISTIALFCLLSFPIWQNWRIINRKDATQCHKKGNSSKVKVNTEKTCGTEQWGQFVGSIWKLLGSWDWTIWLTVFS